MTKENIAKALLEIKAVDLNTEEGFIYASGRRGPIYCDNRLILSYVKERDEVVEGFIALIEEKGFNFDIIAGVATGAIAWGALIATKLKKPMIYIRSSAKDHGKGNQIEGELEEGKRVLVIEDLINTGGSSVEACVAIKESGCSVTACIAIFNYGFEDAGKKFADEKIPLYSLSDLPTLIKVAVEIDYIDDNGKKALLSWQKNPKGWKPNE